MAKHGNVPRGKNIIKGITRRGGLNNDRGTRASGVKKGAKGRGTRGDNGGGKGGAAGGLDRWG